MDWDATVWRRRTQRARGYDCARACGYFVTICMEQRLPLLGDFVAGKLVASEAGDMVCREWTKLPERFEGLKLDAHIAMPDHFHGIVLLGESAGLYHVPEVAQEALAFSLVKIIGAFKSITTHAYIKGVQEGKYPTFSKRFWQRNFYDSIIGTDSDLAKARIYVQNNPARWLEKATLPPPT